MPRPSGERVDNFSSVFRVSSKGGREGGGEKSKNKASFLCTLMVGNISRKMVAQARIGVGVGATDCERDRRNCGAAVV